MALRSDIMAGLVPAIHEFRRGDRADAWNKSGDDGFGMGRIRKLC